VKHWLNLLDKSKLYYLATVYRPDPDSIHHAYIKACELSAQLAYQGVMNFSPIAHSHGAALYGNLDPMKDEPWYSWNCAFMDRCDGGMIRAEMVNWKLSRGMQFETDYFTKKGLPIYSWEEAGYY
jgi:nucleoside 2-deoxyribosyltransferase